MNKSLRAILLLSWQSAAYGIGILGSQLIIYIMLPFLTRYLSAEEYGVVSVITALYAFLNMLTNAGLPSATFRYYNSSQDETERRVTIGAAQFLFFLFAFVPAVGILIFPKVISLFLLGFEKYALVLQVVACYLVINSLNTFGNVVLRIEVRPFISSIHSIILITFQAGFALLFVIQYQMGVMGYWLGYLVGEFIGFTFMICLIRKKIVFQISWSRIWELTKFGFPLIPATLSMTALRLSDRYVIGFLAGLDQVAVYDVGYKVGSIILLLIVPFRTAWIPFAFSIVQKPEATKIYRDVLTYLAAGCSFLILSVIAFRVELIHMIAPATYSKAVSTVSWVAISQLFLAAYHVFSIGPMVMNKTQSLAQAGLVAASTNLLLNFLLIPPIGIVGAAIATFVGYFVLVVMTYFIGKRNLPLSIDWARVSKLFLVSGSILLGFWVIENVTAIGLVRILIKFLGLAFFPILLLLVGFITQSEIAKILDSGKGLLYKKIMPNK